MLSAAAPKFNAPFLPLLRWAGRGGRNSWEMERDLEGKIGREFKRLQVMGGGEWNDIWGEEREGMGTLRGEGGGE